MDTLSSWKLVAPYSSASIVCGTLALATRTLVQLWREWCIWLCGFTHRWNSHADARAIFVFPPSHGVVAAPVGREPCFQASSGDVTRLRRGGAWRRCPIDNSIDVFLSRRLQFVRIVCYPFLQRASENIRLLVLLTRPRSAPHETLE